MATIDLAGQRVLVVTASDRCAAGTQVDVSGPALAEILTSAGATVETVIVSDEKSVLVELLREAAARMNLIVTTGGTGLAARDVTPEATLAVCERLVPGIAELIRREGEKETLFAVLGRGVAGIRGDCLIVNLPGSPKGAVSGLRTVLSVLPHALALLAGNTEHGEGQ